MRILKSLVAVVLVCFSFALNSFGQKVELNGNKVVVNGKIYCFLEKVLPSDLGLNYNIYPKNLENKFTRIPAYTLYSPNKSLIAYILPNPGQIRPSKNTPIHYSILFDPYNSRKSLQYPPSDSIKVIIEDIVNFDVINNNTLDKSSLRFLFEKYGKEVKYASIQTWRSKNEGNCGTGFMSNGLFNQIIIFPNWQVNNKDNTITINNKFIAKFNNISLDKDSVIKKAKFCDQFNQFKASVTLLDAFDEGNGIFLLKYKLITNKKEERVFTIHVNISYQTGSIYQNSPIHTEGKPIAQKIKSQLIKIGAYLQDNYYL